MAATLAVLVSWASAQTADERDAGEAPATQAAMLPHYPAAPPGARSTDLGWFAPPTMPSGVVRATRPEEVELAYVIPIREGIAHKTIDTIRRKLAARPAAMVIFDINTHGGLVDVTEEITELFLRDLNDTYTVAYINPDAFSAGAIIAMACNEIVMSPTGRTGAATPVISGAGGVQDMGRDYRAKMHGAVQSIAEAVAQQNGYDTLLARSMISVEVRAWLIRDRNTMELRIIEPRVFPEHIANIPPAMRSTTAPVGDESQTPWDFLRVINGPDSDSDTVLVLTADKAFSYGLSSATLRTLEDVQAHFNVKTLQVLEDNWSEHMVEFLTSPAVTGILAFFLIIGVYAFTHTASPTSIVIVVICLSLLLGARYLTGLALWWEILVLITGIVLILLEVFVLPGFGVAGILGILMTLVGLILITVPHVPGDMPLPRGNLAWGVFKTTLLAICIAFIAATVTGYYLMRNLPKLPIGRRLALAAPTASNAPPVVDVKLYESIKPGAEGVLESTCRPVGRVRIGGEIFDAMSEGDMIERGERVRVLRRESNTLVVERSPQS